jgi:hypothetical protein
VRGRGDVQFLQQRAEAVAILGQVDGVGRGAQDRHARGLQCRGQVERRLPAELDDEAQEGGGIVNCQL